MNKIPEHDVQKVMTSLRVLCIPQGDSNMEHQK